MSRAWSGDGYEGGHIFTLFGLGNAAGIAPPNLDNTSQVTGVYSLKHLTGGTAAISFASYSQPPSFAANADVTMQGRLKISLPASLNAPTTTPKGTICMEVLSSTQAAAWLSVDSQGYFHVFRGQDNSNLANGTVQLPPNINNEWLVAWRYKLDAVAGLTEVRINGVSVLSATGLNTVGTGGPTTINTVRYGAGSGGGGPFFWDDQIVNVNDASGTEDDFDQDIRMTRRGINANGAVIQLVPSNANQNWQNVATVPPNTSQWNATSTSGNEDVYSGPATGIPANAQVRGVTVQAVVQTQNAPQNGLLVIRLSGTDYTSAPQAIQTTWGIIFNRWRLNPATAAAWTVSDVDASTTQPGVRLQ